MERPIPEYETGFTGYGTRSAGGKGRCFFPIADLLWEGKPYNKERTLTPVIVIIRDEMRKGVFICLFPTEIFMPRGGRNGVRILRPVQLDPQNRITFPRNKLTDPLWQRGSVTYIGAGPYCLVIPGEYDPVVDENENFVFPPDTLRDLVHPALAGKIVPESLTVGSEPSVTAIAQQVSWQVVAALQRAEGHTDRDRMHSVFHVGKFRVTVDVRRFPQKRCRSKKQVY